MADWEISLTHDGASNMVNAATQLMGQSYRHLCCAAYRLDLVVKAALESSEFIQGAIKKTEVQIEWFRLVVGSGPAGDDLRAAQGEKV